MADIDIKIPCSRCNGTGTDNSTLDGQGNPIPESCQSCGGDGWRDTYKIDITDIMDKLDEIKEELDEIKSLVEE